LVINSDDAWRRPSSAFGVLPLCSRTQGASEYHLTATRIDRDPIGIDQRIASKRFLDLVSYLCGCYPRV
jgi:hypothetical protein